MARLCTEWLSFYRELMLCKSVQRPQDILVATDAEIARLQQEAAQVDLPAVLFAIEVLLLAAHRLQAGADRRMEVEMAALKLCDPSLDSSTAALTSRIDALERLVRRLSAGAPVAAPAASAQPPAAPSVPATVMPIAPETPAAPVQPPMPEAPAAPHEVPAAPPPSAERPFAAWREVLDRLRETCAPLYGVLETSDALVDDTFVIICTDNPLFKTLVKSENNQAALRGAVADVTGKSYRFKVRRFKPREDEQNAAPDPLEAMLKYNEQNGVTVNRQ